MLEIVNLDASDTGIEGIICIKTSDRLGAMVKWYPGRPANHAPCLSVTIGPNPKIFNHRLPKPVVARMTPRVIEWVQLNQTALLQFWQHGGSWTRQEVNSHLDGLKKLGSH